jgi:hypothetical protein
MIPKVAADEQDVLGEGDGRAKSVLLPRERFEGLEEYGDVRARLQLKNAGKASNREVDRFMRQMQAWGSGKIAMAWRCYFDSDGDGSLTFKEFCSALASLGYQGNVPRLWSDLGAGDNDCLKLEDLDPENAANLEAFCNWTILKSGGPTECFRAMDTDNSGSVTKIEFSTGLKDMGFYDDSNLPGAISTEEGMMQNLYPLLDQHSSGCITSEQLLFLEKDKMKRAKIDRQLRRIRDHGIQAAPEPLLNDAQRLLFRLSMSSTQLGGKHWKGLRSEVACGDEKSPPSPNFSFNPSGLKTIQAARTLKPGGKMRGGRSAPLLERARTAPILSDRSQRDTASSSLGYGSVLNIMSEGLRPTRDETVLPDIGVNLNSEYDIAEELHFGDFGAWSRTSSRQSQHHSYSTRVKGRKFFAIPRATTLRL